MTISLERKEIGLTTQRFRCEFTIYKLLYYL